MDLDYILCEFEGESTMVFLEGSDDAERKIKEVFGILPEEDVILLNAINQAFVRAIDIQKLMRVSRARNLDLKIMCQSRSTQIIWISKI